LPLLRGGNPVGTKEVTMATIKIKPSHPSQGDFVVIEESEFDPEKHQKYDGRGRPKKEDSRQTKKPKD
jgi:hypothetical protein